MVYTGTVESPTKVYQETMEDCVTGNQTLGIHCRRNVMVDMNMLLVRVVKHQSHKSTPPTVFPQ